MPIAGNGYFRVLTLVGLLACLAGPGLANSSGSGFFINAAWVMTNDHVVDGCARIEVAGHGDAQDILRDQDNDLALVRVDSAFTGRALPFRGDRPRLAEPLHVLGYPLASVLSDAIRVTSGSVSSMTAFSEGDGLMQISAPVQQGNSGGPVLDDWGQVIGVTVGVLNRDNAQNVNFAISGETAQAFLNARGISFRVTERKATDAPNSLPDMIEVAAKATVQIRCHGAAAPATPRAAPERASAPGDLILSRGRDVIGYDYRFLRDITQSGCHAACTSDPRCKAYTFNTRHSACFLKDDATLLVDNADAVSGYAHSLAAGMYDTGFTVTADMDAPGGDYLRLRQSSFIGCLAECGLDAQCRAFAFVRENRDCWLKDRVGRVQQMPGVEFGLK